MRNVRKPVRRLGALLVAVLLGLAVCPSRGLGSVYGYADQSTSGYSLTGAVIGVPVVSQGSTSATQTASPSGSQSFVGAIDPLQSYVGPAGGRPAENAFAPKGQTTPDYSRGDAVVNFAAALRGVAELTLQGASNAAGDASHVVSFPFTLANSGSVTLSFDYSNTLSLVNSGSPAASVAGFVSYNFSIQNSTGTNVFNSSPTAVNRSASLLAAGNVNIPGSGSIAITTSTLAAGSYVATITGGADVFATGVPEPATALGVLALAAGGTGLRRRRGR